MISTLNKPRKSGNNTKRGVKVLKAAAALIFWLAIWEVISLIVGKEILIPSPFSTFRALCSLLGESTFYAAVINSLARIVLGFVSGVIIGVLLAVFCFISDILNTFVSPMMTVIRSTPVASFILLAYLWLTKNQIPGFVAALMIIPVVFGNIQSGLKNTDKKLLECAEIFRFGFIKKIKYVYVPSVKSYFFAALNTSAGFAWKAGIAAEALVRTNNSLGGMIYDSKAYFESDKLFAVTAFVIILSLMIEKLLMLIPGRKTAGKAVSADDKA